MPSSGIKDVLQCTECTESVPGRELQIMGQSTSGAVPGIIVGC